MRMDGIVIEDGSSYLLKIFQTESVKIPPHLASESGKYKGQYARCNVENGVVSTFLQQDYCQL